MKELDYMQLKLKAINKFKAYYGAFDKRIFRAKESRFFFKINNTECVLGMTYYGIRYKQVYKIKKLS